ncbi:MAG: hypothetical protein ACOYOS_17660 [Syntrophales bacterium]
MTEDDRVYFEDSISISKMQEAKQGNNRDHLGRYILVFLYLGVISLLVYFCSG